MRKLVSFFVLVVMLFCASAVDARNGWQGCCSWHGGIAGYCQNGRMVCNDGTLSPSCLCDDPGSGYSYTVPVVPNYSYSTQHRPQKIFSRSDWRTYTLPTTSQESVDLVTSLNFQGGYQPRLVFSFDPKKVKYKQGGYLDFNATRYNIITTVEVLFDHYNAKKPIKLYYSIDNSNFIEVDVYSSEQRSKIIKLYFYVDSILNFYYGLRKGNTIQFKFENNGWSTTIDYSLLGFSYVYGKAVSYLKELNK